MTISMFTPINYARPHSFTEGVLSTLSHYFYLSEERAIVVRGNEVRLAVGEVSWYTIALKVASYVLLFPLTLILLAINLCLRSQHNFTTINSQFPDPSLKNRIGIPLSPTPPTNVNLNGELEKNRDAKNKEETLDTLTKCAKSEENAFLIDFSKVKPSNIFKIFNKGSYYSRTYGDVAINDQIYHNESEKFTQNFPHKFSIGVVTLEKNEYGLPTSTVYTFTMNNEGQVESYGEVFNNFDLYLEHLIKTYFHSFSFEHFDFYSVSNNHEYKKLRKKFSMTIEQ